VKTIHQMLRELSRGEVTELAAASDRLPCVKVGGKYDPVDDKARSTEAILGWLAELGGDSWVDELKARPSKAPSWPGTWTTRVDGIGSVGVQAIMRDGRIQVRFALVRRQSLVPIPAAGRKSIPPGRRSMPPGARRSSTSIPALPKVALPRESSGSHTPVKKTPSKAPSMRPKAPLSPLDALLSSAREMHASDVHLIAARPLLVRVGGELEPRGAPIDSRKVDEMLHDIVPARLEAVLEEQGSCDFALDRGTIGRFRVNVSRQRTGLKATFRLIAPGVPTLESLGLPMEIERATHHHQGLVLVTGPTGHGKTSTLAAIVDIINSHTTHHVIAVEDPVEYVHPRKKAMMSQREVGSHTRSFANALKAALREDPDVIVVGELRDTETVRMALAASETGHLVLGTMNTPSAAKTIDRLVDLFPPSDQQQVRMTLAGGLHLIVSQRLVPAADGKGMVAAVELLPGSIALWSLIRDAKTYQIPSLQQRGKGFGIVRIDDSLFDLVKAGRITKEAALAIAEGPDELDGLLTGKRVPIGAQTPATHPKPEGVGGLLGKAGQLFGRKGGA
jgi:twitching motility protein PilT